MEEKTAGDPADSDGAAGDLFGLPDLPSLGQRWTVLRKAAVIEAVRGGWVPIEEVCRLYTLSVDDLRAWGRDIGRPGLPGLRTTRLQIYRDPKAPRRQADG